MWGSQVLFLTQVPCIIVKAMIGIGGRMGPGRTSYRGPSVLLASSLWLVSLFCKSFVYTWLIHWASLPLESLQFWLWHHGSLGKFNDVLVTHSSWHAIQQPGACAHARRGYYQLLHWYTETRCTSLFALHLLLLSTYWSCSRKMK